MRDLGLILILAVVVVLAFAARALILAATRHGRHEQREQAAEAEADDFIRDLHGGVLPRTERVPLAPLPEWRPRAIPDVAENLCHCGRPAGHLLADLLGDHPETAFDTAQFPAVIA